MLDDASLTDFIQASRVLRISSPLGDDVLLPERIHIREGVNELFEITVMVRSKKDIGAADLIGKPVDIELEIHQSDEDGGAIYRPFNGIVTELHEGPAVSRGLRSYHFVVRPTLWLLSQTRDSRIWLNKTTVEVLETLLSEHGLKAPDVSGVIKPAPPLEYSCQFNESDLRYLLRRLEQDGYFWWFSHEKGAHTLHVADHATGWLDPSASAQGELRVRLARGSSDRNHINEWMRRFSYVPGKRTGADWNYKTFGTIPMDSTPSLVELPDNDRREVFEWPARAMSSGDAEQSQRLRSQASEADHEKVAGASYVRFLEAGRRFQPYDVANPDVEYPEHVIVRIEHMIVDRSYETASSEPEYCNSFEALPSRIPLTPHRDTRRPRVEGLQVAVVAGPEGEEIHCDSDGCIKLWFPWQRHRAKKDGSDTKWIRVATNWAGQGWGGQIIPRIGMEVLVAFLDSDPDRPIVVGLVPNPKNQVPYDLPGNKTRSTFRSNTHKGTGFNEFSVEDRTGGENMFFHAQKDHTTRVLNDRTARVDSHDVQSVGANSALEVGGNQKQEIGGSMNLTVGGTGLGALALMGQVAGLAGQTSGMLAQAGQIAGGGGPALAGFITTLASSTLGFLGGGGLSSRQGVVAGSSPRADAGTALAGSGTGMGQDVAGLFPMQGIMNTVVGNFKSDTIGIARVEQIGMSKVTNVGQSQMVQVGKEQRTSVGETIDIEVGKLYNIVSHEKYHGEAKVWEIFAEDEIRLSAPGGYITINKDGIKLYAIKIEIEGNRINFKKGGPGKGPSCLKAMSESSTPFVRM